MMQERIEAIARVAKSSHDTIKSEEATKMALIVPFLLALGYDVHNPAEVIPEFGVNIAYHNSDKVDFAIVSNNNIIFIVECKSLNTSLFHHSKQLFHYYSATSSRFAVLTNGIEYQFYCDIERRNVMDSDYFFKFNILNYTAQDLLFLESFSKGVFCNETLYRKAEENKYAIAIKKWVHKELESPSKDFISYILRNVYNGNVTNNVIEKYAPIVKDAISLSCDNQRKLNEPTLPALQTIDSLVYTREEELLCAIIKSIVSDKLDYHRVCLKKTASYCTIYIDNQIRKCICRIVMQKKNIIVFFPILNKNVSLLDVFEISEYKNHILTSIQQL